MKRFFSLHLTLILREIKFFSKNTAAMLIFLGAPLVYSILTGFVYKEATVLDLPILIVDLDNSPMSKNIITALDDNQYILVKEILYVSEKLRNKVVREDFIAVVTIPDRFEADIQQKRYPEIDVDINAANMLTGNYATSAIQTVLSYLNAGVEMETLKKKGIPQNIAEKQFESFKINISRFFNPSSNYLMFLWPGMLGTIMQQVFLLVLALSFGKEFEEKTFGDLLKITSSPYHIIHSKWVSYLILGALIWFPLIWLSFKYFRIENIENQGLFWGVTFLFFVSLAFMGIAVSAFFDTQLKSTEVLMVVATPSFIISGQTWPLQQMPEAIQMISNCIPLTHYLEAFRKMLLMQANWTDIFPQIKALLILLVVFYLLAFFVVRFRVKNYKV